MLYDVAPLTALQLNVTIRAGIVAPEAGETTDGPAVGQTTAGAVTVTGCFDTEATPEAVAAVTLVE